MSLHDRIINLPTDKRCPEDMPARLLYKQGHRDARHAAAEMTLEADELMEEMESAIDQLVGMYALKHCDDAMKSDECHIACELLDRYNNWKESTK